MSVITEDAQISHMLTTDWTTWSTSLLINKIFHASIVILSSSVSATTISCKIILFIMTYESIFFLHAL